MSIYFVKNVLRLTKTLLHLRSLLILIISLLPAMISAKEIEEIIVTANFRDINLLDTASSVTVIKAESIGQRQAKHLEQLLYLAPNINFSSGASRGRFIQIRGIGERSQFIEPLNPSVGIIIDGIDFTGIAGAATTMDIDQVELLRGPQGTLFGANALAGLINLKSKNPTEANEGNVSVTLGNYNSHTLSGALSGPLSSSANYRVAIQNHTSDGYITNEFLSRDDTDNIDEITMRSAIDWQIREDVSAKFTLFYVDIDNGYDAFSLDNTRRTLSDNPGHDRQKSSALALETKWKKNDQFDIVSLVSFVDSDLEYGYDEDWAFPAICAGQDCDGWEYNSEDNYLRDRHNSTIDLRLVSKEPAVFLGRPTDWVVGIYAREQDEKLLREYTYNTGDFSSDFQTYNQAIYTELNIAASNNLSVITGLRFESRRARYTDNQDVNHNTDEGLWGGRFAIQYMVSPTSMVYGLISRGYKAGGVNSDPSLHPSDREFDTEFMWNIESGLKGSWMQEALSAQISVFYQQRKDIQIKQSLVQSRDDSNASDFIDYFGNSAKGSNYGLEIEFNWMPTDRLSVFSSVGRLLTEYDTPLSLALNSREQAHAPSYQYVIGSRLQVSPNLLWIVEAQGKDKFYLSSSHNERSQSYRLANTSLLYTTKDWTFSLWGRNLTDQDVIVRGFGGFGNDPRKYYSPEPYYQYGEPRVFGISSDYRF